MQKLRTTTNSPESIAPEEIIETLLVEAGAAGELPTSETRLLKFLELEQMSFDFMHEVDFLNDQGNVPADLRAALSLNDRVVATQAGMGEKRTRFSIFHEIGHSVLPEHRERIFVDNDQTMSWWTKARLEREANQFAADLLFQGSRFTEEALSSPTSLQTPMDLSPKYGASYEASFRRYVERHVVPCAVIVHDRVSKNDQSFVEDDEYKIQYTITSGPFQRLYFSGQLTSDPSKAAELFKSSDYWKVGQIVESEVVIEAPSKRWVFEAEVFSNGYKIFQFLRWLRQGKVAGQRG
jgi:Zn-dependent peptidase ImmA (M78 family)